MANEKLSVVVGLSGGLGNQMFQYAAGRALALRLQVPLTLDVSWFENRLDRHFALRPFRIKANPVNPWPLMSRFPAIFSRIFRRFLNRIMGVKVWREPYFHFSEKFNGISVPVYLLGYWQSEKYFSAIRQELLSDFTLKEPLPLTCQEILAKMKESDAVCVHVRRGDYVTESSAAKNHGTCSVEYYKNGMVELCSHLTSPHFFIFSDDISWAKSNLIYDYPITFVDVNSSRDAHLDLILMTKCKHFLIANSSLSWWAAWLSCNPEKIVIAPYKWFVTQDKNTQDLIPETWRKR